MSRDAVLITGTPGAGKSSVAEALGTLLELDRISYAGIETDQLSWGWPWLTVEQWLPHLHWLAGRQWQLGREALLVVTTTENEAELEAVRRAIQADRVLIICLSAPAELCAQRVAAREPDSWPGKARLVEHARALARVIPELKGIECVISTEARRPPAVAAEIRELMRTRFEGGSSG